jgi:prevent-host-death family protein
MTMVDDHGYHWVMDETTVKASVFKARCLALLDDVARTRRTIVVTKRGRPVAKLVPLDQHQPTMGSVTLLADDDEAYFSTGEHWDAEE